MASRAAISGAVPAATRSVAHLPRTSFMMGSAHPVRDTAAARVSEWQPQPMRDESPTRPGVLLRVPPVDVAAARLPRASRATAPTVSWLSMPEEDGGFLLSQVSASRPGAPGCLEDSL